MCCIAPDPITMPGTEEKYILNVIDFTTRYIIPAAVPTTSTKDFLKHLHSLFYRFGAPEDCLFDHAKSFESHHFKNFMRMYGVNMHFSVAYCAASNGHVERANRTLVTMKPRPTLQVDDPCVIAHNPDIYKAITCQ
ncbi:uncharacterized protein [Dermacentor albipictus]|uniref:uncharacterized protein n=1 Tax=Dermacentor albipictus TaxID=60249 RepID=UPI0038FCC85D